MDDNTLIQNIVHIVVVLAVLITAVSLIWGLLLAPHWRVWSAHKDGEADLARAKNEQAIQVAEAQSRLNAADLNKRAAIIEAEAVSAQIKAIGDELNRYDLYLKWQWIKMMEDADHSTIYVPTEANIPILEAGHAR